MVDLVKAVKDLQVYGPRNEGPASKRLQPLVVPSFRTAATSGPKPMSLYFQCGSPASPKPGGGA